MASGQWQLLPFYLLNRLFRPVRQAFIPGLFLSRQRKYSLEFHDVRRLDAELLPISSALRRWCKECNKRPRDFVLYGGEDYELIFTMAPEDFKAFRVSHPEVTAIGTVTSGLAGVSMMENGREVDVPPAGFHHFSEDK